MALYRITTPAYFCPRDNAMRPANELHVNGDASRDMHLAQMANAGCPAFVVTELSAAEYRAAAMAKLSKPAT